MHSKEFLAEIADFAQETKRLIEAAVDGFDPDPKASKERHTRAMGDFEFFCQTYFPHYVSDKKSQFHEWLFKTIPSRIDDPEGHKVAVAAPRGEAKSTILTQLHTLWCVLTERKHYPVIIMDSFDQSALMLEAIKAELEGNVRLRQDFPKAVGAGRVWQVGVILTRNNRKIQVAGSGKKIRGWRHGPYRPDLVVLDDIENDENVKSPAQRDKLEKWIKKAVLKLGPPDGSMDVLYVGTILHYDSVLNRTLRNPTWESEIFKAIISYPDRMDLWEKWEEILINEGALKADAFYRNNKRKMDQGAVVSWPEVRPLLALIKIRADDQAAFDSEMQNDPTDSETAIFKTITFWVQESDWIFYGACDPSLGKKKKTNDYSATLIGGWDKNKNRLDVVEAVIARKVPSLIIEDIINFQRQYGCLLWAFETIQFQEFMLMRLMELGLEKGVPIPARAVVPNTDKLLRIESMQPFVSPNIGDARIRIHKSQNLLHEQLKHFPQADHDDGPDSLEMLWKIASSGAAGIPVIKTAAAGNSLNTSV